MIRLPGGFSPVLFSRAFCALSCLVVAPLPCHAQTGAGSLTPPPGAPAPTMKSLVNIDPGTPLIPANAPFILSSAGSYYLTGNVTTIPANAAVITIAAPGVTIDLRGFSLIAAGSTGTTASHSAILSTSPVFANLTIRNGHINGAWFAGVYADVPRQIFCENVNVRLTKNTGIQVGANSRIAGCQVDGGTAVGSGFVVAHGIRVGIGSLVEGCTVERCDGDGISLSSGCSALDCVSYDNGDDGIVTGFGGMVSRCTTYFNDGDGISLGTGSSALDCIGFDNGITGITAGSGCAISRCAAFSNTGNGIETSSSCSVGNCTAFNNDGRGFLLGDGCIIGNSAAYLNDFAGFEGSTSCSVTGCAASQNAGDGFAFGNFATAGFCTAEINGGEGFDLDGATVSNCLAASNTGNGFSGQTASLFVHCVAQANGQTDINAAADGFEIAAGCRVVDSTSYDNEGAGIRCMASPAFLKGNLVHSNDSGGLDLPDASNLVIGNYTTGNTGFDIGPAVTPGTGLVGPLSTTAAGADPHANFQ